MTRNVRSDVDSTHRDFENELNDSALCVDPGSDNYIAQLSAKLNDGFVVPQSQTIGNFAGTLQAIQAELHLMASIHGFGPPQIDYQVAWDEILAAADALSSSSDALADFTPDQLTALALPSL